LASVHTGRAVLRLRHIEGSFEYHFGQRNLVHVLGAVLLLDLGAGTLIGIALPPRLFRSYCGAVLYLFEAGGTFSLIEPISGVTHKYSKLLVTCIALLVNGCRSLWLGLITGKARL
jgi:hypothetical protein|tara:strand:- start:148 stop:495 length:348 start_codon:yes stop_codon:yes gene_type:complete